MVSKKAVKKNSSGSSLVVQKMKMVQSNCAKNVGKARPKKVLYRNSDASSVGRKAGAQVSLNSQIEGSVRSQVRKINSDS